ncbi:ABC transporter permease [Asanoa sp. NPDC049518]|uniref:ABC transporter permease n=1 Tax=unclassified Asanoa TaxID=2685164 RepID=UPI0034136349
MTTTTLVFGGRALKKFRRTPIQLLDVAVHPVVFTLIFSFLFGGAVGGSIDAYIGYLVPGILVMTLLVTTGTTGAALSVDIATGVYDRFRTLSIRPSSVLFGALLGDLVRYVLASIVVLVLGFTLGFRPGGGLVGVVGAVLLVLLFAVSLSWVWTLLALTLKTPGAVLALTQAVLYPLSFFSNIFTTPATLPGWLQAFVDVNPVSHLVSTIRALMAGTAPGAALGWLLLGCALLTAVFAPLALRRFRAAG